MKSALTFTDFTAHLRGFIAASTRAFQKAGCEPITDVGGILAQASRRGDIVATQRRNELRESLISGPSASAPLRRDGHGTKPSENDHARERMAYFEQAALELFALQFEHNGPYRTLCEARGTRPGTIEHWSQIPSLPTAAFKEFELSCLPIDERTAVFHSSGTTGQAPSRHFHGAQSLAIYEASLLPWFAHHVLPGSNPQRGGELSEATTPEFLTLTPPPQQAPHSSLVHMFEVVSRRLGASCSRYAGCLEADSSWGLDHSLAVEAFRHAATNQSPVVVLGTAFMLVHLLDGLAARKLELRLPPGSRVLETGGYKGRSRSLPKAELHGMIERRLGLPQEEIVCEYGMSELSSQAYSPSLPRGPVGARRAGAFHFPPWARVQVISPESGREVAEGETGLIRVFDLANVYSVMAIQTEDLGIKRGDGFDLIGRSPAAEPRGCSLMATESSQ